MKSIQAPMFTYYARILLRNGSSTRPIYTLMHCKPLHTQMHSKQMRQFSLYDGLYCGYCNNFSTSVHASAIKKPQDEIAAQTAQKKSVRSARDERIVQVFDQNGLFVEKTRLWKAMSDAKKRDLRLVEMKSASGSKKKEKDADESDLNSYKLVSQNEFSEFLEEKKKEQIKSNSLKQIQMKAKIDQTGLTVKLNQIKELLAKKGKLKILIEDKSRKEGSRQAIASVFKKVHSELQDIATLHEAINTDSKMMIIVTQKQSENKTEDKS